MKSTLVILFLSLVAMRSQSQADVLPTLDNLLKLKWSVQGSAHSSNPLVHDGLIFETFGLNYALDAATGEKLFFGRAWHQTRIKSLTRDSLVCFSERPGVALVNIFSGKIIFQSKNAITTPWVEKPRLVRGTFLFTAISDSVFAAIDVKSGEIAWKKKMRSIYNYPLSKGGGVYVSDSEFLYILDSKTGSEKGRVKLGIFGSDPILISNVIYVWLEDRGLVAYDLEKSRIVWEKKQVRGDYEYKVIIENEIVYTSEDHLRALSIKNGRVIWENDNHESIYSHILLSTKKYFICYKPMDDSSVLVAAEKSTGTLKFEAFTTVYDFEGKPKRPLAHLEGVHFRFADEMHKNLLYAVDPSGKIYCFEVGE